MTTRRKAESNNGMTEIKRMRPLRYRSIFISDIHLGSRSCQASRVLDFLRATECKQLYLVSYISSFETAVAMEAGRRKVDGMICGHIHHAEMRDIGGVVYCNCGDWVESCTALVEHHDGRLDVVRWIDGYPQSLAEPTSAPALARAG